MYIPSDPAILLLGIYPTDTVSEKIYLKVIHFCIVGKRKC